VTPVQPEEAERDHQPAAPPVKIGPLGVHVDHLEPLWLALHEHHLRISPRLAGMPARSTDESWARRRAVYIESAKAPGTFVLAAEADNELVGYAFVTVSAGYSSWNSGEWQAQLETLSVAPAMRGKGVGERLLAAVCERLAKAGIETISLSAICANEGAHRFYERHGFRRAEIVFVGATAAQRDLRADESTVRYAASLRTTGIEVEELADVRGLAGDRRLGLLGRSPQPSACAGLRPCDTNRNGGLR
jgi:ribosomal protein S18 acetylase RimI-like enzyme